MSKPKPGFSPKVVKHFYDQCNWTHEVWLHHLELFDNNPREDELLRAPFTGAEFQRLFTISQEYALLQIAKLHDPAVVSHKFTLTIDYMVKHGGWSGAALLRLTSLQNKLDAFAKPVRVARHKILSHTDLANTLAGKTLGAFPAGEDVKYFKNLQEFVKTVHHEVLEGPYIPFNTLVKNDVVAFLATITPR